MKKNRKPIKAKWEWVNTPDAKERLRVAFDIIFSGMEEICAGEPQSASDPDPEYQERPGQLPLF